MLGEDGSLQGMPVSVANLPFVGSDAAEPAARTDKRRANDCYAMQDRISPRLLHSPERIVTRLVLPRLNPVWDCRRSLSPPIRLFGSGVSKVANEAQYQQAVALAFEFDHKVVVEQGIKGREIECAVLEVTTNHRPVPAAKSY